MTQPSRRQPITDERIRKLAAGPNADFSRVRGALKVNSEWLARKFAELGIDMKQGRRKG